MRLKHGVLLLALALVTTSCVTTRLMPGAESVRITTNADVVRGCKFVGEVKASDRLNGGVAGQDAAEENTDRRIRNAALELGADTVFLGRSSTGFAGASARGEAYTCGSPH